MSTRLEPVDVDQFFEGSGWSFVWAFLFGPIYFLVHGFIRQAIICFLLFPIYGIVALFLVRNAWWERAEQRADVENIKLVVTAAVDALERVEQISKRIAAAQAPTPKELAELKMLERRGL